MRGGGGGRAVLNVYGEGDLTEDSNQSENPCIQISYIFPFVSVNSSEFIHGVKNGCKNAENRPHSPNFTP